MTWFRFGEYWWFYALFTAFVLLLLALDLGVFHRKPHAVSAREAGVWSAVWIALALAFNLGFYRWAAWKLARIPGIDAEAAARQAGLEFLTGYLIEKALSLDNLFVFVAVFAFFGIPAMYQHRVLFYGILGALVFRGIFIALGAALFQHHWVILIFGGLLIVTGVQMALAPARQMNPERNPLIRLFRRFVPVTGSLDGPRFFTRVRGAVHATPLAVSMLFLETSDVVFAADSVPAIFAVTREPLIVFTSNVFALLGLRSLYFLLAGAVERFSMLKYGLAAVLVFVGLKMVWLNDAFGGKFPIGWSLAIIGATIAVSMICSLARGPSAPRATAERTPVQ